MLPVFEKALRGKMPFALESVESCPLKARAFKLIAKGGKQVQEMKLTSKPIIYQHMQKFYLADVKREAADEDEGKAFMKFAECTDKQAVGEPLWSRFLDPIKHDMNDPFLVGHSQIFPTGIPSGTEMITEDHRTAMRDFVWQRGKEAAVQRPMTTLRNRLEKKLKAKDLPDADKAALKEEVEKLADQLKEKLAAIPSRPASWTPLLEPIWNAWGAWSAEGMIEAWTLSTAPSDLEKLKKQGGPITKEEIITPTGRLKQRAQENKRKGDDGFATPTEIQKAEMLYTQQGMLRQGKKNFNLYQHTAQLADRANRLSELRQLEKDYREMAEDSSNPEEAASWEKKQKAAKVQRMHLMETEAPPMAASPSPIPLPSPLRKRTKYAHLIDTATPNAAAVSKTPVSPAATPFTPAANGPTHDHSPVTIPYMVTNADAHNIAESLVEEST